MKTWRLVAGILSIILSLFVTFQSGIAGLSNAMQQNGESSGSAGLFVAIFMLTGGIISICVRKGGKGGSIALAIVFLLAFLLGISSAGSYKDLVIWSYWCLINGILAVIGIFLKKKTD